MLTFDDSALSEAPVEEVWKLLYDPARMAFAQALSAQARGDHQLAERRLREAEGHWRRLAGQDDASREHLASLVDLGRPPVTGVVDPAAELERVAEELHAHVR